MTTMTKSGNSFVGLPNTEELLSKTNAVMAIKNKLRDSNISPVSLAQEANMPESYVDQILYGINISYYGLNQINKLLDIANKIVI